MVNKIGTERSSDKLVSFRYQTFKYERAWAVVSVARPSSMRGPEQWFMTFIFERVYVVAFKFERAG